MASNRPREQNFHSTVRKWLAVLYAARPDLDARRIATSELQFFWGAKYLVTLHAEPFAEIDDLVARVRTGTLTPVVSAGERRLGIADLVYRVIDAVVDGYFPAVDALAEWSEDVEEVMFSRAERRAQGTLQMIFGLKNQEVPPGNAQNDRPKP